MKFHILGLSHFPTMRAVSSCAFTTKVRLLCKMLVAEGHHVIFYGVEGSDLVCSENVTVLDEATRASVHGPLDQSGFPDLGPENAAFRTFTANAISEIAKRKQPGDFLLCPFGVAHKPVADAFPDMIVVE